MAIITASPKNMGKMIELQEKSLGELSTMRQIMEEGGSIEVVNKANATQEKLANATEELVKTQSLNIDAVKQVADNFKIVKTPLEKLGDKLESVKDTVSDPARLGLNMLPNFLGGFKERLLQRNDFKKAQRALGSDASNSELNAQFKESRQAAKEMQKVSAELAKLSALTGLSESQLGSTRAGAGLLARKDDAAGKLARNDLRAAVAGGDTPAESKENQAEEIKRDKKQTELLETIAKGVTGKPTGSESTNQPQVESADGGNGGLMGTFGARAGQMKSAFGGGSSNSMIKGAAALVLISGAVFIAGKAMQEFAEVEWEDVGKGVTALGAMTVAAMALGKAAPSMLIGSVALGLIGGAVWIAGGAFKQFGDLDWETIGKGLVAVGGIGALGAAAGTAAPLLIAGAAGLAALGGAAWIIGEAMQAIGEGMESMVSGLERLGALDGEALTKVGTGITDIGLALVAFGAGNVVAGLGTLVGNLLTIGQDSPIEQLQKFADMSNGLVRAAVGIRRLGTGIEAFSNIDRGAIESLEDIPFDEIKELADSDAVFVGTSEGTQQIVMGHKDAVTGTTSSEEPSRLGQMASGVMDGFSDWWNGNDAEGNPNSANLIPAGGNGQGNTIEAGTIAANSAATMAGIQAANNTVINAPSTTSNNTTSAVRPNIRNVNPTASGNSWWSSLWN